MGHVDPKKQARRSRRNVPWFARADFPDVPPRTARRMAGVVSAMTPPPPKEPERAAVTHAAVTPVIARTRGCARGGGRPAGRRSSSRRSSTARDDGGSDSDAPGDAGHQHELSV